MTNPPIQTLEEYGRAVRDSIADPDNKALTRRIEAYEYEVLRKPFLSGYSVRNGEETMFF